MGTNSSKPRTKCTAEHLYLFIDYPNKGEANLPRRREDQETKHSSFSASIDSHHRPQYQQDDVKVYQEDRDRRTRRDDDVTVYEEDRYRQRNHFPEVELSREK
ncbi:MAG: hypothetical protein Q9198_005139 [Flavoplaca austrocitrina]